MSKEKQILTAKSMAEAIAEAKALIQTERSGVINGLYTRWPGMNNFFMKYLRFSTVTAAGGMSGSGKSAILTMIEDDFTNPVLNPTFLRHRDNHGNLVGEDQLMILAFKYEMDAADDVLRNLSGKVEKSYAYLLSSEKVEKGEGENKVLDYHYITDAQYEEYCKRLDAMANRPLKYIEHAGNLEQLYATCAYWKEKYPNRRLIVTIDHTLLSKKLSEKDDLELTQATAQTAIRLRKNFNAMVIFLCQLNGEIEKPLRKTDNRLHFPGKTDIHCGNQLYWACDNVIIFHRPELLGIDRYGHFKIGGEISSVYTKGVIHGACIKSRKNTTGNIWFAEQFAIGNMVQIRAADIKVKRDPLKVDG